MLMMLACGYPKCPLQLMLLMFAPDVVFAVDGHDAL